MPRSYVQPEDTTMTKSKDVLVLLDLTLGGNETVFWGYRANHDG